MSVFGPQLSASELQAISAAARWYAQLKSGAQTEQQRSAFNHWHAADPLHQQAWERMQRVDEQMASVPGRIAAPALRGVVHSRRNVLRGVLVVASASSLAWLGVRSETAQNLFADLRTRVGERREFHLADGSSLLLNTDTSVNVRFDGQQRLLELLWGEILVSTAADPLRRPFRVDTRHGQVLALGTRFLVRSSSRQGEVAVLEKAVQVHTREGGATSRLEAGQRQVFSAGGLGSIKANDASVGAWRQGSIIALNRPLGELLDDLSRYRHGVLRCSPQIADLKVSGAFPINDTDLALAALESGFSLRITRYTAYWVSVSA